MPAIVPTADEAQDYANSVAARFAALEARVAALEAEPRPEPEPEPEPEPPPTPLPGTPQLLTVAPGERLVLDPNKDVTLYVAGIRGVEAEFVSKPNFPHVHEIVFADVAEQAGLVWTGGRFHVQDYIFPRVIRLAVEPFTGDSKLVLDAEPIGWQVGDRLRIPDTRQTYRPDFLETNQIASIAGNVITLAEPLSYDHLGARDAHGVLDCLGHVVNIGKRRVIFRSENPRGARGFLRFQYDCDLWLFGGAYLSLGSTLNAPRDDGNPDNQFPITLINVSQPHAIVDTVIRCGLPDHEFVWGIGAKGCKGGTIARNVADNWAGSGYFFDENCEETVDGNIAIRTRGRGDRQSFRLDLPGTPKVPGGNGAGFWFTGPLNRVRNNIACNTYSLDTGEVSYGYRFGAGDDTQTQSIAEFSGNEAYGQENGLTIWFLGNGWASNPTAGPMNVLRDTRFWHLKQKGAYFYDMANVCLDGWVQRGDWSFLFNDNDNTTSIYFGDYPCFGKFELERADIQGLRWGFINPYHGGTDALIADSHFACMIPLSVETIRAPGHGPDSSLLRPNKLTIRNVTFNRAITKWTPDNKSPRVLWMKYLDTEGHGNITLKDEVFAENWDGTGLNYQFFYPEQAATTIMRHSGGGVVGCHEAGLTNAQAWSKYGIATAGAVMPEGTIDLPGVKGKAQQL